MEPLPVENSEDPVVSIEPLLLALRQERYVFIKNFHVWDIPLSHVHMASLVSRSSD